METQSHDTSTRRRSIWIAGVLIAATALLGGAAHVTGRDTSPHNITPPEQIHFTAPGAGPVSFAAQLDRTRVLRGHGGRVRIELLMGARAETPSAVERVPTDLVVILDRSGSMAGEKIEHARAAIRQLISQLTPGDRFALVSYADFARRDLALSAADGRDGLGAWLAAVEAIQPNGGTNMSAGLDAAARVLAHREMSDRTARVILISDGLANRGDARHEGLVDRASRTARGGALLSTVGVGEDFNEYLMTALADAGTGNYYYLRHAVDLASVFAEEFESARTTVASALAVHIEPGEGVRVLDAAGYPLERERGRVTFRPGALFAGQERRVWVTLQVPDGELGEVALGRFWLEYAHAGESASLGLDAAPLVACVADADDFYVGLDDEAWSRSVIVEGYNEVQERVARWVKEGRRSEALDEIERFRSETMELNRMVQSPDVSRQLEFLAEFEDDVEEAFAGEDRDRKQNLLSKSASSEARDARRAGSKRGN
jgi:Ca-activated chloride channel family protein